MDIWIFEWKKIPLPTKKERDGMKHREKKALKIQFGQSIFGILPKFLLKGHFLSFPFQQKKIWNVFFLLLLKKKAC